MRLRQPHYIFLPAIASKFSQIFYRKGRGVGKAVGSGHGMYLIIQYKYPDLGAFGDPYRPFWPWNERYREQTPSTTDILQCPIWHPYLLPESPIAHLHSEQRAWLPRWNCRSISPLGLFPSYPIIPSPILCDCSSTDHRNLLGVILREMPNIAWNITAPRSCHKIFAITAFLPSKNAI